MGKRISGFLMFFVLLGLLSLPLSAQSYAVGEVLYHQDFSHSSGMSEAATGIRKGTASSPESYLWFNDSALHVITEDDLRTYALLPEIPWTDSYTIEFTFRFGDVRSSRGYLAFLLTCWGEEPSNITSLVIRADGSIDDFEPLSEEMIEKIQDETDMIHVEIPIENGVLYEITLTAGDTTCTVQRNSLKRITEGNRGFGVRNLMTQIGEVYVVNGTGYTAKTGEFAKSSWSDDPDNNPVDTAPDTSEPVWMLWTALVSTAGVVWAKRTKKRI